MSVLDFSYAQLLFTKFSSLNQKHPHTLYTYDVGMMEQAFAEKCSYKQRTSGLWRDGRLLRIKGQKEVDETGGQTGGLMDSNSCVKVGLVCVRSPPGWTENFIICAQCCRRRLDMWCSNSDVAQTPVVATGAVTSHANQVTQSWSIYIESAECFVFFSSFFLNKLSGFQR